MDYTIATILVSFVSWGIACFYLGAVITQKINNREYARHKELHDCKIRINYSDFIAGYDAYTSACKMLYNVGIDHEMTLVNPPPPEEKS